MFYNIIHSEEEIKRFIDMLPDDISGVYYLQLLARKKYLPRGFLNSCDDEFPIYRIFCKKDEIFKNIKKMEVKLGGFIYGDKEIPNNSLGCYISMNPIDLKSATKKAFDGLSNAIFNNDYSQTPDRLSMRKAVSKGKNTNLPLYTKRYFHDMDYDTKDGDILNNIIKEYNKHIGKKGYNIIESSGGYHVIVKDAKNAINKKWYMELSQLPEFDNIVSYTPIPGTYLGNFKVKQIY